MFARRIARRRAGDQAPIASSHDHETLLLDVRTKAVEPPRRRLDIVKDFGSRSDTLGEDGIHPCHAVEDIAAGDDRRRPEVERAEHVRRPLDESADLLRRQVGCRTPRVDEFGKTQVSIPLFDIEVCADFLKSHNAIGARNQASLSVIDGVVNRHDLSRRQGLSLTLAERAANRLGPTKTFAGPRRRRLLHGVGGEARRMLRRDVSRCWEATPR